MMVQSFSDKPLAAKLYTLTLFLATSFLPEKPAGIENIASIGLIGRRVVNKR